MGILAAVMVPHPPLIVPEVGRGEEKKINDTIIGFTKATELIAELAPCETRRDRATGAEV